MSANLSDIAVGSIQTLGNHQFKIIRQIGEGSTGLAYKAYLMRAGVADDSQPFAIKVDKSDYFILREFRLKKLLEKRQKEAQKQSHLFESVVYRIGNRIVTLMPMLPGQPIFDEYGMPHPHLVSLTLSERLELAALVVQTYLEFHADGLFHVDLNWDNVLIYIERLKGKAYFQCNIIDFTNNSKYVALIGAPEYNLSLFFPTPSIKSDIYSLTFLIAIILGETNVFKNKLPYKFGSKAAEFPFYLEGMKSYLRDEYSKLSNNGKAEEPTDILVKPDRIIEDVINTVTKMGSNEPKDRPDEFKIVEVLIKASLACRKMEMELTESDLTTEIAEVADKQKKEFYNEPIRNHLLVTAGIWAKPNQSLRVDDRQGLREISVFRA